MNEERYTIADVVKRAKEIEDEMNEPLRAAQEKVEYLTWCCGAMDKRIEELEAELSKLKDEEAA